MELRLGDLLRDAGVLTEEQVQAILAEQQLRATPFGVLAERMYGVAPEIVEQAWAMQYAGLTRTIDPAAERYDDAAKNLVNRRQAWQFRVLPVRFEPRELMIATTAIHLPRALRFAANTLAYPVFFVMAEPEPLGRALCEHYPFPGLTPRSVADDGLDRLLSVTG